MLYSSISAKDELERISEIRNAYKIACKAHDTALMESDFVPWKNNSYKKPHFATFISLNNEDIITSIECHDVLEYDLFSRLYEKIGNRPVFSIYCRLNEPVSGNPLVTDRDVHGKKLYVATNSAFFLVNEGSKSDMDLMYLLDMFNGSHVPGNVFHSECDASKYFGEVPIHVFAKYLGIE